MKGIDEKYVFIGLVAILFILIFIYNPFQQAMYDPTPPINCKVMENGYDHQLQITSEGWYSLTCPQDYGVSKCDFFQTQEVHQGSCDMCRTYLSVDNLASSGPTTCFDSRDTCQVVFADLGQTISFYVGTYSVGETHLGARKLTCLRECPDGSWRYENELCLTPTTTTTTTTIPPCVGFFCNQSNIVMALIGGLSIGLVGLIIYKKRK